MTSGYICDAFNCGDGFGNRFGNDNPFACCESICFHDPRKLAVLDKRNSVVSTRKYFVSGSRHLHMLHDAFGERLATFEARGLLRWSKHRHPSSTDRICPTCSQRRFGANDDQIDRVDADPGQHIGKGWRVEQRRQVCHARIARGDGQLIQKRRSSNRPRQRVFTSTIPEQQNTHA